MTKSGVPTVLIVDDELDMRFLVRIVLKSAQRGIEVVGEAVDGLDALSAFDELDPPVVPDVVILDNRMPEKSGLEVAAEMLRRVPVQHIVLFSAHLNEDVRRQAAELGVSACMSKDDVEGLPDLILSLVDEE